MLLAKPDAPTTEWHPITPFKEVETTRDQILLTELFANLYSCETFPTLHGR